MGISVTPDASTWTSCRSMQCRPTCCGFVLTLGRIPVSHRQNISSHLHR